MEGQMNQKSRTILFVILLPILVAAAVLAATWAASTFWQLRFPWMPRERPSYIPYAPGDIEFFYIAKTVISTLNIVLLIFLLAVYLDIYRKTRSEFTIGLIIFSTALLFYALTSNPIIMWLCGFIPFGLGPFALLPELFTFAALVVLLYLSVKY